ncbi:PREDICTED: gibberellin 2-beta-dioxygenase 8 isoform X2 [Ipomoea nil]|uniref:gibberellin 2-beta-dioxygenase 8 isoform X2 n=1 Tax=Ipomoea nil TaxID=35883 RepID=UPI00090125CA|nr:PREDICTED: gibberellin 2-beta-dioxygenase 8 isoform X2 [Ipomoea nil]
MSQKPDYESYPPLFRPSSSVNPNHGGVEKGSPEMEAAAAAEGDGVPVIDFECMKKDEEKVTEACREWGLFRLVNHGIPESLMSQMLERARELFSMAYEAKQGAFNSAAAGAAAPAISYFWGTPAVTPSGAALASSNLHWMEGLNIPLSKVSQLHYEDPMIESFRSLVEEYGKHQARVGKAIYEALWRKVELGTLKLSKKYEESCATRYLSEDTGILRVYRYPRCLEANRAWGIDVHTDSSLLSILHQDLVGGLQVYKDHQWIQVNPIPNTLIVNIGDMIQAISDDKYVSVKHRVKVNEENERISVGYFVFPGDDVVIESSNYKPFTYAQFRAQVQHELKSVGFKIGLHNFKR